MKGPLTEETLLFLGKRKTLGEIKALDLSNQEIETLEPALFNQLVSLEALDLSWNKIRQIPPDLVLNNLRVLDCSNNELSSVEFVCQVKRLEELYIDDNENLNVDDAYIAKSVCPSLKRVDDLSDIASVETGIRLFREQLTPQIEAVWEAKYSEVYNAGIDSSETEKLHEDFIRVVNSVILGFNADRPKFQQFLIKKITQEIMESINKKQQNGGHTRTSSQRETPNSKYRTRVRLGNTPVKEYSKGVPMEVSEHCENKPPPVNNKKRKRESLSSESPSVKRKRTETPEKVTVKGDNSGFTVLKKREDLMKFKLPVLPDYDPVQFIRCHSQDNSPTDSDTKVWKCAFQPSLGGKGNTSEIVATCGGRIVCLIDCHTFKLVKRYKDSSDTESFYCLAWTTLQGDGDSIKDDSNILAVAGQDGTIKLIDPRLLIKYSDLEGHKDYISALVFHPSQPNILFSASRDGRIIQWNIGLPNFQDVKSKTSRQLSTMCLNKTDAICMVVNPTMNILLAGCETSCFGWKLDDPKPENSSPDFEFIHPVLAEGDDGVVTVDSLSVYKNNIVSKCVGSNSLYLWDLESHLKKAKKGSGTRKIHINNIQQLEYVTVEVDYLYTTICKNVLAVGDDKGNIHMYNLQKLNRHLVPDKHLLQPSIILNYPELEDNPENMDAMEDLQNKEDVVMNCVALSSNQEYLVCGTDKNLVCVWRKSPESDS